MISGIYMIQRKISYHNLGLTKKKSTLFSIDFHLPNQLNIENDWTPTWLILYQVTSWDLEEYQCNLCSVCTFLVTR